MSFDPNQPFEIVDQGPRFDPAAPFEIVPEPTLGEKASHVLGTVGRAAADTVAAFPDMISTLAERTDARLEQGNWMRSNDPKHPGRENYATAKIAQIIRDSANNILPAPDPRMSDSFWLTDVPSAVGTAGAMIAGGGAAAGVTRAAGLGAVAASSAAVAAGTGMGFAAEFEDAFDRATRLGQSPDEALARSLGYATVAAMIENKLGAGRMLRRYFPGAGDAFATLNAKGVAPNIAKDLVAGFAEEASQRLAQNAIVAGQLNTEGAWREGAAGAVAQAAFGLPASFAHRHGNTATADPLAELPDVPPPQELGPTPGVEDDFRMEYTAGEDPSAYAPPLPEPAQVAEGTPVPDETTDPETPMPSAVSRSSDEEGSMGIPMDPNADAAVTGNPATEGTQGTPDIGNPISAPVADVAFGQQSQAGLEELAPVEDWSPVISEAKGKKVTMTVDVGEGETQSVEMSAPRAIKRQRAVVDVLDQIRNCLTK